MATGKHLRIKSMGTDVMGVEIRGVKLDGKPEKPEPLHFRVTLPVGADVDVVRLDNGDYWVHVHVNNENGHHDPFQPSAEIVDARADQAGKHASETSTGDVVGPNTYHVAVRLKKTAEAQTS